MTERQTQTIFPAIDLRQGHVVRLQEGDPSRQTTFDHDPVAVGERWLDAGARWLHVVNLDGAFDEAGKANWEALPRLAQIGLPLQFGGGIRTLADVDRALNAGATRVILGTAAVERPSLVSEALTRFGPERVIVSLDARDGIVRSRGWQTNAGISAVALGKRVAEAGVQLAVHTDISRDGILVGANVAASEAVAAGTGLAVIVSGGVASLKDVVASRGKPGIAGVIIGRALYDGRIDLTEAINALDGRQSDEAADAG